MKKHLEVVAAIIKDGDRYFAAQRNNYGENALKWEFPGGKVEPGETHEEALSREIKEELKADIFVGEHFISVEHEYETFSITLHAYLCQLKKGSLVLTEHLNSTWLTKDELLNVNWAPADFTIVKKLISELSLDNRVVKSLIDKTVNEFSYNPQIVTNQHRKTIKSRVIENLEEANQIDIAISYVVWSGLSLIFNDLKKFGPDSRILITTEGYVTDPVSLRKLKELNLSVKIYNPLDKEAKGFHLKSYYFSKEEDKTILIGSNNISARAFGLAHEMMVEIDSKEQGYIVSEYLKSFEELWNDDLSVPLTDEFIDKYETLFYEKKRLENTFYEYKLLTEKIQPNYMQEKALIGLAECRENGGEKGLVIAATGTGKTYLAAFDVKNMNANKVLFLVHNRLILTNAIDTFKKVFPNHVILELKSSNLAEMETADLIFTTDKTAHSYLLNKIGVNYFDYIIFDEAHRIGEDTYYQDLIGYFKPKFTLGITATPERTKDPDFLFKTFEYSVPYEIRLLDALNIQLVCPFVYYGLNIDDRLLATNEKFDYFELAKYIKEQIKDKKHYGKKLKALLFATTISEAKEISKYLNDVGFHSVIAVSGESTQEDIEQSIASLKKETSDSVEIICTVNKFNEGIDIPDINMIIMLRNTHSSIIYLQQLGRGLRRTVDPDKFVTVLDFIGNSNNNYSIAQVLTGNKTADKRELYKQLATDFVTVSPFVNVFIEEKAKDNILQSISNNFTVKSELNKKFKDELSRFEVIPTLKEMYNNPYLQELDLLQLLNKSFYEAFDNYYDVKYKTPKNNLFLRHFFRLITQFIFRGYNEEQLSDYARLLKGQTINNITLIRILVAQQVRDGIPTAINSNYNKTTWGFIDAFILTSSGLSLNPDIIRKLKELNAYELFVEHIDLIEELAKLPSYKMGTFELVEKAEFLFNSGSKDCYMNSVGELIDHEKKEVFSTIKITKGESFYANRVIDRRHIVYLTQYSKSEEAANKKVKEFIDGNYIFNICAKFPHLGYTNTSYFNLGKLRISNVSDVFKNSERQYNHTITFELEEEIPQEFLMY